MNLSPPNNYKVTKSNKLIEASYKLTLEELRLLLASIAQIDSRKTASTRSLPDEIKITTQDYAETFKLNINSAYGQLKKATDTLFEREIRVKQPAERGGGYKRMRWVTEATYPEGKGYVLLRFSKQVQPLLYQLETEFTSYQLASVSGLSSVYSIRIYEMIMQFKKTGERLIKLSDFKTMLEISSRYKMFSDLRKRVIEPAIQELNSRTDLEFDWEPIKDGRKVTHLAFTAKKPGQFKLPL